MLEIAIGVIACVAMAKIASADDLSPVIWFCITFALCFVSLFIPLPFLRILLAAIVAFFLMMAYKMKANA